MKKTYWLILIATTVLLSVSPCVNASYVYEQKETLLGIGEKAMGIVIEELDFKIIELGLTEDKIRTDVEPKLKLAKIKVLPNMTPHLYVRVTSFFAKNIPDHVVYSISVDARREVALTSLRSLKWDRITKQKALESLCNKDSKTTESICERVGKGQLIGLDEKTIIGCTASVWNTEMTGAVPTSEMEKTIRNDIKNLVDQFLNDYLAVNSKKVSTPVKK